MHNAWVKVSHSWFLPTSSAASWHLLRIRSRWLFAYIGPTGTYRSRRRGTSYQQDRNVTAPDKTAPWQNLQVVKRPVLHQEGLGCDGVLHEPIGQRDRAMLRSEMSNPSAQTNLIHVIRLTGLNRWPQSPRMHDTIRHYGCSNRQGEKEETHQTLSEVPRCAVARHPGDARSRSAEYSRQLCDPEISQGSRVTCNWQLCLILHRILIPTSHLTHLVRWFTIANQIVTSRESIDSFSYPDHRRLPSRRNISELSGGRKAAKFTLILYSPKPS